MESAGTGAAVAAVFRIEFARTSLVGMSTKLPDGIITDGSECTITEGSECVITDGPEYIITDGPECIITEGLGTEDDPDNVCVLDTAKTHGIPE